MNHSNLCEICNIGQLQFVAKSNTGSQFVLLKCLMCDSQFKYENGLLVIVSKGNTYKTLSTTRVNKSQ